MLSSETEKLARLFAGHPELAALLECERGQWERDRASLAKHITSLEQERDRLRASHERLRQLELFKRQARSSAKLLASVAPTGHRVLRTWSDM